MSPKNRQRILDDEDEDLESSFELISGGNCRVCNAQISRAEKVAYHDRCENCAMKGYEHMISEKREYRISFG